MLRRKYCYLVVIIGVTFLMSSCQTYLASRLDEQYKAAVVDAALAEEEEIADNLLSVNRGNNHLIWNEEGTKLLVVTWKATGAYEKFIKPYIATSEKEEYVVWVTLAPQVPEIL